MPAHAAKRGVPIERLARFGAFSETLCRPELDSTGLKLSHTTSCTFLSFRARK
jgi:hypothetical protein